MQIALTGDVMLGRRVAQTIEERPPEHVWGSMLPLVRGADLRIINLECVIAHPEAHLPWMPPKTFSFIGGPKATQVLKAASIDVVTLANNHTLDYRESALLDMLELLGGSGIRFAGAGRSAREARSPVFLDTSELTLAVINFTDNEPAWEATDTKPGVFYAPINLRDPRVERLTSLVREARRAADVVLVTAHWGPNMVDRPPGRHPPLARGLIEAGADCFAGHSAHVFQGIEIHQGKPILYDLGDFVDDYAVDPTLRNDRSFLWVLDVDRHGVKHVDLIPVLIDSWKCQVNRAQGREAEATIGKMVHLCAEMGTQVTVADGRVMAHVRAAR
jgi:poly-gamma-glutamate synthesis protein (capsule biosynthesis protein)